jgi:predicted nucleic-acid-binding protein
MSNESNSNANTGLKKAIADVLNEMQSLTADTPEFAKCVEQLDKLYKIKNSKKELNHKIKIETLELNHKMEQDEKEHLLNVDEHISKKKIKFSPDTLLAVAGNLVGIVAILGFEKANVVTSKALGFVTKTKI